MVEITGSESRPQPDRVNSEDKCGEDGLSYLLKNLLLDTYIPLYLNRFIFLLKVSLICFCCWQEKNTK